MSNDGTGSGTNSGEEGGSSNNSGASSGLTGTKRQEKQLAKFIKEHLRTHKGRVGMEYKTEQIIIILDRVKEVLKRQGSLVRVRAPVKIVGDIHGQYTDLKRHFRANGRPPDTKYLFLGDYVDRGKHSLECIMLLFAYKALYPDSIILLRGNHECSGINRVYGFYDEMERRGLGQIYPEINTAFDYLPLAATVNGKILCMHGGISQHLAHVNQIKKIRRPCTMNPGDCPDIALDLLWADPDINKNGYTESERGVSHVFGMDALEKFCRVLKIDLIVRGHQVVPRGFERIGPGQKTRLVTVFSAPNYCNEFDNSAAVMIISEKLSIHFSVLEPSADAKYKADREANRQNTPQIDVFPHTSNPIPPEPQHPPKPQSTASSSASYDQHASGSHH